MSINKIYLTTKDYLVTQEKFSLVHDTSLDMLITTPQPKNLSIYYEDSSYISHQDKPKNLLEVIYQTVKKYTLNKKIKFINKFKNDSNSLLDIGAGTGEFILHAKNAKWKTIGVEPGNQAREKANKKGLTIVKNIDEIDNQKFDVITLWHVLEHLPDLDEQLNKIEKLLKIGGTLIVAVPNFKSYDAKHYKEFWAAYDTPRHLWHFSQKSISTLFNAKGLEIIKTTPMYFDSYYVSLLSEKYKKGNSKYLKAVYHGWLSNYKARATGEYSSLIYTLQRM